MDGIGGRGVGIADGECQGPEVFAPASTPHF